MISCVCPTHGRGWLIGEAVESYLRQQPIPGVETELLLFNDCPEQPLQCDAPGVRVVNLPEPIPDLSAKFNLAVAAARGDWVAWWEDDDISLPGRLAHAWAELHARPGCLYLRPYFAYFWNDLRVTHWHCGCLCFGGSIFHRDYFQACGGSSPGDWADGTADGNMVRGGSGQEDRCTPADTQFVYRWAGIGVHHDSAIQGTNADRFRAFRARTLADPRFVPGPCAVVPYWAQDYPALVADFIAREKPCKPN
jgi:glycosyltransferase involved in cell wall biosynthesis